MSTSEPPEFYQYHRRLKILLVGFCCAGGLLIVSSVVSSLFRSTSGESNTPPPNLKQLRECATDLELLSSDIERTAMKAIQSPNGVTEWKSFNSGWMDRWTQIGSRCHFSTGLVTEKSKAHARLSEAYDQLPQIKLRYQDIVLRFADRHQSEILRIQSELELATSQIPKE